MGADQLSAPLQRYCTLLQCYYLEAHCVSVWDGWGVSRPAPCPWKLETSGSPPAHPHNRGGRHRRQALSSDVTPHQAMQRARCSFYFYRAWCSCSCLSPTTCYLQSSFHELV